LKRGKLIALEGIDGSGTTTQAKLLFRALKERGHKVLLTSEPSRGPAGRLVRDYLQGRYRLADARLGASVLALLFAADRLEHLGRELNPWLATGGIVLTDRYLFSSLAYQSLACDPDWVETINRHAPLPDLTLLLDLPATVAFQRVNQRGVERDLFEKLELQKRIRRNYLRLAQNPRYRRGIIVVDAASPIKKVSEDILNSVLARI